MDILFVAAFFVILSRTGISLPGIVVALVLATIIMMVGGMFTLLVTLLPWLLLAVVMVWAIRKINAARATHYRAKQRWRY